MKTKSRKRRIARLLRRALPAGFLSIGLTSCALFQKPAVKVIDPNTTVMRVARGTNFQALVDGYFVPDATMWRILDQLGEKSVFGEEK
jgi:hypothetical protein